MKWIVLLLATAFPLFSGAQSSTVSLPQISSQYLTQVRDGGARVLVVGYTDDQAYLHSSDGNQPFTQTNLLDILADPKQNPEAPLPIVRIEVARSLPLHYWHTLYFWLQISGYTELHFTVLETGTQKKGYIAVPIAPFFYPEQAYATALEARSNRTLTPLQLAQQVHPHTNHLTSIQDPAQRLHLLRTTKLAYIPQHLRSITLQADGEVVFQGQAIDPMMLSALLQSELATHYQNSYQQAAPQTRLWMDLQTNSKANIQHYAQLLSAVSEAYHLYWEELAFNQHQKTYPEISLQERATLQEAAPMLSLEYDPAFRTYWQTQLQSDQLKLWQTQP